MKLLTFQARHFGWQRAERSLPDAPDLPGEAEPRRVADAVVCFLHAEAGDEGEAERKRAFRATLKHLKWLANKRDLGTIVLHSFAHLGGANAAPEFTRTFLAELAARLEATGYAVHQTPFGWFCAWDIAVGGESLAKVWKEI